MSLRSWRRDVGIPLATLAQVCGVQRRVLQRLEAGQVEPRAALVARVTEVTGLEWDELLGVRGRARLEQFRRAANPKATGVGHRRSVAPCGRGRRGSRRRDPELDALTAAIAAELKTPTV